MQAGFFVDACVAAVGLVRSSESEPCAEGHPLASHCRNGFGPPLLQCTEVDHARMDGNSNQCSRLRRLHRRCQFSQVVQRNIAGSMIANGPTDRSGACVGRSLELQTLFVLVERTGDAFSGTVTALKCRYVRLFPSHGLCLPIAIEPFRRAPYLSTEVLP